MILRRRSFPRLAVSDETAERLSLIRSPDLRDRPMCVGCEVAGDADLLDDGQVSDDGKDPFGSRLDGRGFVAGDIEEPARVLADCFVLVEAQPHDLGTVLAWAFTDERNRSENGEPVCRCLNRFVLSAASDLRVAYLLLCLDVHVDGVAGRCRVLVEKVGCMVTLLPVEVGAFCRAKMTSRTPLSGCRAISEGHSRWPPRQLQGSSW